MQILLLAQHVLGTIMPIIRSSRVLHMWLLPVVFGAVVLKLSVWCRAVGCVSGLLLPPCSPVSVRLPMAPIPSKHIERNRKSRSWIIYRVKGRKNDIYSATLMFIMQP